MKTVTVICPAYNEEDVIGAFYKELKAVLSGLSASYESTIIFVVDGAEDSTLDILKRIAESDASTQILSFSKNFGHQMALLAGIDHAHSDAVIMMDTDLQHPPSLLPALLRKFEEGYEVVYTIREDTSEIPWFKRASAKLFYRMLNLITQVPITENAADFRLISRRVATVFRNHIRERNQFMRGLFAWVGFRSAGVPFTVGKRGGGRSKYSLLSMVRFGINGLVAFSKRPLLAAAVLGFALAAFGFCFAAVTVIQYLFYSTLPSGWATLVSLLTIFSGTQLIFLGILGLYIGAIFDEVKGRPHYIIEEKINCGT
jgi:dolichol-phosphate mannosyltransferase